MTRAADHITGSVPRTYHDAVQQHVPDHTDTKSKPSIIILKAQPSPANTQDSPHGKPTKPLNLRQSKVEHLSSITAEYSLKAP
jgi:hypothetical protein